MGRYVNWRLAPVPCPAATVFSQDFRPVFAAVGKLKEEKPDAPLVRVRPMACDCALYRKESAAETKLAICEEGHEGRNEHNRRDGNDQDSVLPPRHKFF